MRRVLAALGILGLVAAVASPSAQTARWFDLDALDRSVATYRASNSVPGMAIAVTRGADLIHTAGFGHDGDGRAITSQTKLPIASLSKSFTSLAVMQLVEAGKVSLDAPVRNYVSDFKLADPRGAAITVRQLLAHRSGLSDKVFHEKSGPLPASLRDGVAMLGNVRLGAEPGEKFQYHNPNYWIAARLVEVVSGESFPDYLGQHVFAPLGMRNTTAVDRLDAQSGVAKGYVRIFTRPVALREPDWFLGGASGVVTTANDMARWLAMQNNAGKTPDGRQIVSAAGIEAMHEGLGWQPQERGGTKVIDHSGWMFTFTAHQVLIPSCRCGVAVMSNVGLGLAPVDSEAVADMITDLIAGQRLDPPPPIGFRVDAVLMVVTAVVLVCGVRALWLSSAWAAASVRRRRWRTVANRVLWLSPLALLLGLPSLLGLIFAGRDASYTQMLYVVPSLAICLAAASAMGLFVVIARSRRQQSGPGRES